MIAQAAQARKSEMFNLVEEYQKSGISQNQFCEEKNLPKSTFLYWLRKYRKQEKQASGFIPVNISGFNSASEYRIELPNGIQIHLSGSEGLELIAGIISETAGRHASHK